MVCQTTRWQFMKEHMPKIGDTLRVSEWTRIFFKAVTSFFDAVIFFRPDRNMSAESMGLRILVACPQRRVELHGSQKTGPCRYSVSKALRFSKKTLANFFSAQRNHAADKTRLIRCLAPVKPLAAGIHPEPGVCRQRAALDGICRLCWKHLSYS